MLERIPKYTLRKLSVGLASVMIGSGILMSSPKVLAATNAGESTGTAVQSSSQDKDNSKPSTQGQNTDSKAAVQKSNDNSFAEPATKTGNNNESENELKLAKKSLLQQPQLMLKKK